ncbi:autotransporter outer membrane beta-barrel domain-containing protein [Mesorhizobium sp. ASY16-5R]|uniref:autotransporter outer membrane beta-barrel domain-containing protein n=1 Tax=Mesorhizobium sp. ASY16-5R TaxID=3445772 RepID=UPI003FA04503
MSTVILPFALLAAGTVVFWKTTALADEPTRIPLEYVYDTADNGTGESQHYVSRLGIWTSINNGQAQRYVFDTGSDQFNTQIGPEVTGVESIAGSPKYVYAYGDSNYGYLIQKVTFDRLTYLDPKALDDQSKAITLPILGEREYEAGRIDDIIYTLDYRDPEGLVLNLTKDPVTNENTTDLYGNPLGEKYYYADLDARDRIESGKPADEDGRFSGTFGAGDYLIGTSVKTSMIGGATTSGYIVAANGNTGFATNEATPGCSPCVIVNLDPSLRAQYMSFAHWGQKSDDDKKTYPEIFPGSEANASMQYEGAYSLGFGDGDDENAVREDEVAALLDTGTPGGGTLLLSQSKFSSLERSGVEFKENENSPGTYYLEALTISAPNGDPVTLKNIVVSIDEENTSADYINFISGIDFFLSQSVMYDLENSATAFTSYFVTADNFSTDAASGSLPGLTKITPEMGSVFPAKDEQGHDVDVGYLGIAGAISGTGDLEIAKNANVRLSGTNTYEGETLIEKGASVELTGPGSIENSVRVVNNGTLDLQKKGNFLKEWGVSDAYNDTRIRSLGGSGEVLLLDRTLVLTDARDTFAGSIGDIGADGQHAGGKLSVLGGMQTLSGQNSFTGLTTVGSGAALLLSQTGTLAGKVSVSGLFANDGKVAAETTVEQGGVAAGVGVFGGLTVARGGTVAPGSVNDPVKLAPVLTVDGDFVQQAGSIYLAGIAPGAELDKATGRIAVSGGAAIDDGANVDLVREGAGQLSLDTRYTLLTAAQGVSGAYGGLTGDLYTDSPFIDFGLAYDANNVYLDVDRSKVAFADVGGTFNQKSVATATEALGSGHAIYDNVLFLTERESRSAFDLLSGEVHASASGALIEDSHFVRDAASERIRAAFAGVGASSALVSTPGSSQMETATATTDKLAVWGRGFGAWGHLDGDGGTERLDYSTGGFLSGADALVADTWRLGLLAGYSRTSFDIDGRSSSGSSNNYHLGAYAGTQWERLGFRSGLAYSWYRLDTRRAVAFTGFSDTLSSGYDAGTFQAFGELGYRIDTAAVALEPYANLAYVHLDTDGFQEKGGTAALHGSDRSTDTAFSTLGLRASSGFELGSMSATAHGGIGWLHAYGDVTPEARLAYSGGTAFDVKGTPIAEDAALIEAGFDMHLTARATVGLAYQGQIASEAKEHGFNAKLAVQF